MPGHMTPAGMVPAQMTGLMSGQMTPNGVQMLMGGQVTPPCVSHKMIPPPGTWCAPTKATLDASNASTTVPSGVCSGACSDGGSDIDEEEEDAAQACAELISQIEEGGAARTAAIEALEGSVQELAFDPSACRVVQKALELADVEIAASLAQELVGKVREAIKSPHANHVVQKMLEVLPAHYTSFVMDEVLDSAAEVARHRYGCRVLCRVVERHSGEFACNKSSALISELLLEAAELSRHTFSHYVIESILQFGTPEQRHSVSVSLRTDLLRNAKQRSSTYVVEKALACCDEQDCNDMVSELFGTVASVVALVENQFGCHVAKSLVRLPGDHLDHALSFLDEASPLLKKTKYGRRLLDEFKQIMI